MTNSSRTAPAMLSKLADGLRNCQGQSPRQDIWPKERLKILWDAGIPDWFIPDALGGNPKSNRDTMEMFLVVGEACLTTAFILTQFVGAVRRISSMACLESARGVLNSVRQGAFTTLGISHLTTSRQHQKTPALTATPTEKGFILQGVTPWVTGAAHADWIVTGAIQPDGQPVLLLVPCAAPGVTVGPPAKLVALGGSDTGGVTLKEVFIDRQFVVLPPGLSSQSAGAVAATGGLQTTALALALTRSALGFLWAEAASRPELRDIHDHLAAECEHLVAILLDESGPVAAPTGRSDTESMETKRGIITSNGMEPPTSGSPERVAMSAEHDLRARANSLVLRTTHAAMTAAKGAGYVEGHPVGRWCREALFFLVWSCPPAVMQSQLCEFADMR